MTITTETLRYRADSVDMEATLYRDSAAAAPRAGVLVFPEALGPGQNVHDRARRLAEAGYAALVCDLHGGARLCTDMDEIMALIRELSADPSRTRDRARGALDVLASHPQVDPARIAATGYCFGGTMALELGRSGARLGAIVGFHCGLATIRPDDAANITARVLVCIGAEDPAIPVEQRNAFEAEMRAGHVDWSMHVYGGVVHSFTNERAADMGMPDFARYDAAADNSSWHAMLQLFARTID